ncbi:MAG: hypothetical protein WC787_01810 [Patescibacteria group bacterium]
MTPFLREKPYGIGPKGREVFPLFDDIYRELDWNTENLARFRPVQEALLTLYTCKPEVFRVPGIRIATMDIDVSIQRVCLRQLAQQTYGYLVGLTPNSAVPMFIPAEPIVLRAFGMIYELKGLNLFKAQTLRATIQQRLFRVAVPDPRGIHFMTAVSRMLLAIDSVTPQRL